MLRLLPGLGLGRGSGFALASLLPAAAAAAPGAGVDGGVINAWAIAAAVIAIICLVIAIAVALRFRHLERRMAAIALTDSLTLAPNRRAFMESALREFHRVKRGEQALGIGLLDIDRFKLVNDTWGHDAGDAVLRDVVRVLRAQLRVSDHFGRIGGEEFAFLLPGAEGPAAAAAAEKLRAAFEARVVTVGSAEIRYTASIGVTQAQGEDQRYEDAIKRADEAVYRAKRAGRNRVEAG